MKKLIAWIRGFTSGITIMVAIFGWLAALGILDAWEHANT